MSSVCLSIPLTARRQEVIGFSVAGRVTQPPAYMKWFIVELLHLSVLTFNMSITFLAIIFSLLPSAPQAFNSTQSTHVYTVGSIVTFVCTLGCVSDYI